MLDLWVNSWSQVTCFSYFSLFQFAFGRCSPPRWYFISCCRCRCCYKGTKKTLYQIPSISFHSRVSLQFSVGLIASTVYYSHAGRLNFEREKKKMFLMQMLCTLDNDEACESKWEKITYSHNRSETMAFCDSNSLGNSKFTHDIHMVVVVMTHTIDTLAVYVFMYVPRAEKEKHPQSKWKCVSCSLLTRARSIGIWLWHGIHICLQWRSKIWQNEEEGRARKKNRRTIPERNIFRFYFSTGWEKGKETANDTETEERCK